MSLFSTDTNKIRQLGLIFVVVFSPIGIISHYYWASNSQYLFFFLTLMGICLILFPLRFSWFYKWWFTITNFIGKIVSYLMLIIVWYVVITPSALLMRVLHKKPLALGPDKSLNTYWVKRNEPIQPKQRYHKRY